MGDAFDANAFAEEVARLRARLGPGLIFKDALFELALARKRNRSPPVPLTIELALIQLASGLLWLSPT